MADTDIPGFGGLEPAPSRPQPIASPFGALPGLRAWAPPQQPGFNVTNPGTPSPAGWLPPDIVSSLLAALTPSKQDIAETLGAPVDLLGWAAHRAGLAVPGNEAPPEWTPALQGGRQPWIPGASVPLSSQNIRGMLDNPPPLDAFLQAMRRHG